MLYNHKYGIVTTFSSTCSSWTTQVKRAQSAYLLSASLIVPTMLLSNSGLKLNSYTIQTIPCAHIKRVENLSTVLCDDALQVQNTESLNHR